MQIAHLQAVCQHNQDRRHVLHGEQHALEGRMQLAANATLRLHQRLVHLQAAGACFKSYVLWSKNFSV